MSLNNKYDENWALIEASKIAVNSPCKSKRGVIIWNRTHGLISFGWNAPPLPFVCDGTDACKSSCSKTAVHAEQAAIINFLDSNMNISECEMLHVKVIDGKAVVSEKPSCWQCSKLILSAGIKYMWLYTINGLIRYTPEEFHKQTIKNCNL